MLEEETPRERAGVEAVKESDHRPHTGFGRGDERDHEGRCAKVAAGDILLKRCEVGGDLIADRGALGVGRVDRLRPTVGLEAEHEDVGFRPEVPLDNERAPVAFELLFLPVTRKRKRLRVRELSRHRWHLRAVDQLMPTQDAKRQRRLRADLEGGSDRARHQLMGEILKVFFSGINETMIAERVCALIVQLVDQAARVGVGVVSLLMRAIDVTVGLAAKNLQPRL